MDELKKFRKPHPSIVILTGAGISAESGIRTFRDHNGLWENHRIEEVATPDGFARNPQLVQEFYNQRRRQLKEPSIAPNPAHLALARLEREWKGEFLLVTQNVDDLHDRAGNTHLLHMHGELLSALCLECRQRARWEADLSERDTCLACGRAGYLRPDIVWFGEMPYHMGRILEALCRCDIFLSIGTSGQVYPAAGFVREAVNAERIEVNKDPTDISDAFHEHRIGPAGREVPRLVEELLGSRAPAP
ncbi:MAG: Sir2 family NAD+-dependent deacetylase [Bdellovibrionales bacterium]